MKVKIIALLLAFFPSVSFASGFYLPGWLDWFLGLFSTVTCDTQCEAARKANEGASAPSPEPVASEPK